MRLHPHITEGWSGQPGSAKSLVLTGFSDLILEFSPSGPAEACIAFDSALDQRFLSCDESRIKIGVLWEPLEINQVGHEFVRQNITSLEMLLTHDERLLEEFPDAASYLPVGGSYFASTDRLLTRRKTRLVSISASTKRRLPGHQLRHQVIERFAKAGIDCFGRAFRTYRSPSVPHRKYLFSIVIENVFEERFFTEKLIHACLYKTVPIYWGAKTLPTEFDEAGILRFEDIDQLSEILPKLGPELYRKMESSVEINQLAALEYASCEINIQRVVAKHFALGDLESVSVQDYFPNPTSLLAGRSRFLPDSRCRR